VQTPEQRLAWLANNPDYYRRWREQNLEKCRERSRVSVQKWRERNPGYSKKYYKENAARIADKTRAAKKANPEKFRERDRRYWKSAKGRAGYLLLSAKQRSKNVTITRQWIQERLDHGFCEVTGLPFIVVSDAIKNPWSPSLDQIKPGQGYTPENTQLVVWIYNVAKGSWAHGDVLTLAESILRLEKEVAA
jgi:hypothetical protein